MLDALTPLLALGFLIERILEIIFDILAMRTKEAVENDSPEDPTKLENQRRIKNSISFILSIGLGIGFAFTIPLNAFPSVEDQVIGQLITGLAAGAIAPYAHQLLEILRKGQKSLEKPVPSEKSTTQSTTP